MPRAPVDLHIRGTEAFADYEGADLILYVVHDPATPEKVQELRQQLSPQLASNGGRFHTFRLKAKDALDADWT